METLTANGLSSVFTGNKAVTQQRRLWRPWTVEEEKRSDSHQIPSLQGDFSDAKFSKTLQISHPVKLYWPKSKCFDYLYQDAEILLRNYPVQATICPYEEGSSDEESDDEEEEDMDKDMDMDCQ
ncbi:protein ripply2 [Cynoglossus semilaevis]|uniref:Ripply transcriptional repressor 2 n=1 Tax=Cynoglossus semilaevis TaxID=244447 RepID=A0A3P8WZ49_CYNSE|nr:protein ripply2-like [Cynoglossus semilaevis]XP_024912395.1 protein ripply2-like [Cynoglossus semilaevis]XP_024912396.1 protein ripply2-like [Cynoglossus semilaevis]